MNMPQGQLVYLTAPDCAFCTDGRPIVQRLGREMGLEVAELAWDSPRGKALVGRESAFFPPAVYLDDRLLGYGRVSERKLRKQLAKVPA
jgi:hypothetical protein